ncbi:MAG: N-acylglucosamine 2-epimerase [Dictyoglomus sp. NZ13-RE01]|nr:MAG: N-acylglucosamine 2-epimerase [Dictyoglomus sp. NZ13-RE01]
MEELKREVIEHLNNKIIPFWESLIDKKYGGFIGFVDFDLNRYPYAPKSCVLQTRILWFFSSAYNFKKDESLLEYAEHAYEFVINHIWDKEKEGLFWMVNHDGSSLDTRKHVYAQAFGIYALSEYYSAVKDSKALDLAIKLFEILENKCRDDYAYWEEFERDWTKKENIILGEYNVKPIRSMNSLLHILEAYTNLYKVWKDPFLKERLINIINLFKDKIYNFESNHFEVFLDSNWTPQIPAISYGHDIEGTWLLDLALETIGEMRSDIDEMNIKIAETVLKEGFEKSSLINEKAGDKIDKSRVWWVQAEALVGFLNAYNKTKDQKFLKAVTNLWDFIKNNLVDKRENSEWFSRLDEHLKPVKLPIVEPWKCPYHNGRMCIEVGRRI